MKLNNISLENNIEAIEITIEGVVYDLHNIADFLGYEYSVRDRTFKMIWYYRSDKKTAMQISLIFSEVQSVIITERDPEMPYLEDDCLDELFYDLNDGSVEFHFWGGIDIKAKAAELKAEIEKLSPS